MKKNLMLVLIVGLLVVATIGLVACGGDKKGNDKDAENGKIEPMDIKETKSQIDALMEVKSLTADAAIIDATMAGYLLKSDGSFGDLKIVTLEGVEFEKEYYGVAAKKGNSGLIAFVNQGIKNCQANGKYNELLAKYGLEARANDIQNQEFTVPENWSSQLKGNKVVIGFTNNAPMGISDDKDPNKGTGFDIELAQAIFANTGIQVETRLIEWDNKEIELENGSIDLVWNGLTITPERKANMEISAEYLFNEQAIVVLAKDAGNFTKVADLSGMKVVVEAGSAGADNAAIINANLQK